MEDIDPCEAIAVLNPRAVDQSRVVIQMGIPSELSVHVLGRLAKCSIQASCLARIKYADMQQLRVHLHNLLIDKIKSRYPRIKIVQAVVFADLAIQEVCDPKACRWCRGSKQFPDTDEHGRATGKFIVCGGCNGSGKHVWHDSERMHKLQIAEKEWKNKHMAMYNHVLSIVLGWDSEVREAMA